MSSIRSSASSVVRTSMGRTRDSLSAESRGSSGRVLMLRARTAGRTRSGGKAGTRKGGTWAEGRESAVWTLSAITERVAVADGDDASRSDGMRCYVVNQR